MALRSKLTSALAITGLFLTAACSPLEEANNGKGYAGKADTHAYTSGGGEFTAGGYKAGDKTGWAENLNVRAKGQNEYVRTGDSAKAQ